MSDPATLTQPTDPAEAMMYWHERAMAAESALADARAGWNEALKAVDLLSTIQTQLIAERDTARAEAERLREDKARLDWMNKRECGIEHEGYGEYRYYCGGAAWRSVRDVIDDAMRGENDA